MMTVRMVAGHVEEVRVSARFLWRLLKLERAFTPSITGVRW
jgi:hypothetical protein